MLTASSFAKVSGKLGALGKPLGLTAEMASVTMFPGPIEVRNHHSSAQSSAWGGMGWGKAALAPASSECSHQHFSLLSYTPRRALLLLVRVSSLSITKCIIFFFLYFLHLLCPSPTHFFSYSHFNSSFTSDCLPQNTSKYSACANATLEIQHTSNQVKLNQGRQEKLWKF